MEVATVSQKQVELLVTSDPLTLGWVPILLQPTQLGVDQLRLGIHQTLSIHVAHLWGLEKLHNSSPLSGLSVELRRGGEDTHIFLPYSSEPPLQRKWGVGQERNSLKLEVESGKEVKGRRGNQR